MPVLCLLSLISRNSPKQLGMVSPELLGCGGIGISERMSRPQEDAPAVVSSAANFFLRLRHLLDRRLQAVPVMGPLLSHAIPSRRRQNAVSSARSPRMIASNACPGQSSHRGFFPRPYTWQFSRQADEYLTQFPAARAVTQPTQAAFGRFARVAPPRA